MSQEANTEDQDVMRSEYDFANGIRGTHYEAYGAGTNLILLDPDLARVFKDSASVNSILRLLLDLAKGNVRIK